MTATRPIRLALALAIPLIVVALALLPATAGAYQYSHVYCNQNLPVNGTCPPYGSFEWAHMELNTANAGGQSHATCVDDWYNNEGKFTPAHCMYYASEGAAIQISAGQYGYPRAWNGGSIEHFVYAEEYGYHTGAIVKLQAPIAAAGLTSPLAALAGTLSAIPGGLDTSAATVTGAAYPVVVIPGETSMCLLNGPAGISATAAAEAGLLGGVCGSRSAAEKDGFAETTESASGAPVVIGLPPVGNTTITVTSTNGTSKTVPV